MGENKVANIFLIVCTVLVFCFILIGDKSITNTEINSTAFEDTDTVEKEKEIESEKAGVQIFSGIHTEDNTNSNELSAENAKAVRGISIQLKIIFCFVIFFVIAGIVTKDPQVFSWGFLLLLCYYCIKSVISPYL